MTLIKRRSSEDQQQRIHTSVQQILKSWTQESFVFSYVGKGDQNTSGFCLSQKETHFSLAIGFRFEAHCLVVTGMTLVDNTYVGILSEALYDAALVEILLQAIMLSVILCRQNQCTEIVFILPSEDAENLKVAAADSF